MLKVASSRRSVGGFVGLVIGLTCGSLAIVPAGQLSQPGAPVEFGLAAIVAGAVAGWLVGPAALRATSAREWIAIIVGMAVLAVSVGAFTVAFTMAVQIAAPEAGGLEWLGEFAVGWLALGVLGVLILGLPALAITIVPAGIWAAVMAWLAGRRAHPA